MTDPIVDYMSLIRAFLRKEIPITEFQCRYAKRWQEDECDEGNHARRVLDDSFGELGSARPDTHADQASPDQQTTRYPSAADLHHRAKVALGRLEALNRKIGL